VKYRDNIAALQLGHEGDPGLEAQIRANFPADEADKKVAVLQQASQIGEARKVVDTMGPEAIQAKADQLQADLAQPGTENYEQKARVAEAFHTAVQQRDTELKADPNAFVPEA